MMTGPLTTIEQAFAEFRRLGAEGRRWTEWAALFSSDAEYIEHCLGVFRGNEAITDWIESAMTPVACMTFSVDWALIDGDRVAFWIWNHLPDPAGSDRPHDFGNLSILTYRPTAQGVELIGEEDFYSSVDSGRTVINWYKAGGQPSMAAIPSLRPHAPGHPPLGAAVPRSTLDALADRIVHDDWRDVVTSYAAYHDHGLASIDVWASTRRVERYRVVGANRVVVVLDHHKRDGTIVQASVIADTADSGRASMFDHCYNPTEEKR
jgi:SnoaL-like domain